MKERQLEAERRLMERQVQQAAAERQALAHRLHEEETHLETNLRAKLEQVQQEKVQVEQELEVEQEYVVNRLQKQLSELASEKEQLESQLHAESDALLHHIHDVVERLFSGASKSQVSVLNRIRTEVDKLFQRKADFAKEQSKRASFSSRFYFSLFLCVLPVFCYNAKRIFLFFSLCRLQWNRTTMRWRRNFVGFAMRTLSWSSN